ncbi:MAG TPA: DUF6175 family protein [Myxococcota bacterium]|nr:DUF6175 family protein [Myxococcota bacterium]
MKQYVCCFVMAMIFLLDSQYSRAEQSSMPNLSIMVKAKAKPKDGKNIIISMSINDYLMKNKMPQWDIFDSRDGAAAVDEESGADVIVEFGAETKDAENVVVLTVSARDTLRDKQLFAKSAFSSPRNLKQPGAWSAAASEAVTKVMPEVITGLKKHYWSLARNGTWSRVTLEDAPKDLERNVEEKLKKDCYQTERCQGKPGFLVQCKLDNLELFERIDNVIKAASPGASYDVRARTNKNIKLEFRSVKKKDRKKKSRKRKR